MDNIWVGIISAGITAAVSLFVAKFNNSTTAEGIYAEHTKDLWKRLDTVSNQLENVTAERDELKDQVQKLQDEVEKQSKLIDELTTQIGSLNANFKEERNEKIIKQNQF